MLATEVHRRLISDCNGRRTDFASSFGRGLGSMSPPLAVVFVSVHYIGLPPARVAVYAWLTVPTRGGNRGRGHRGCIAVVVACCARRPFALGSWLFARVLGKRGKRGYNTRLPRIKCKSGAKTLRLELPRSRASCSKLHQLRSFSGSSCPAADRSAARARRGARKSVTDSHTCAARLPLP